MSQYILVLYIITGEFQIVGLFPDEMLICIISSPLGEVLTLQVPAERFSEGRGVDIL
jgi:hypothetical protein